ncbi:ankyrin repeat and LEM domain-containing 2 [Elysia marginata]|uniref:Ankyrin repeat and LEM domain-containing 2 n=1 Tax=Elysia marginata TaxID=1093978 RepID=A0AAV4I3X2_9GAST|nr:ankyrin repeat and LEM domain-containing 2 [Elysia marginata]
MTLWFHCDRVVCSRYTKHDAAQVRDKILELIRGGTCYVPLIRSDTTGPYAKVGTPYSPTSPYRLVPEIEGAVRQEQYHQQQATSPLIGVPFSNAGSNVAPVATPQASPVVVGFNSTGKPGAASQGLRDYRSMRVWAYAGPMSPQEAEDFRREWKCPSKGSNLRESLKVSDGDRGYERFGRSLAEEHKTSWQEYWPFLDAFADLRSPEGLKKMEVFLLKQRVLLLMQTMASWKGGGRLTKKITERAGAQNVIKGTDKAHILDNVESVQLGTTGQELVNKVKCNVKREVFNVTPQEKFKADSCFVRSVAYKVSQQYVLNPDPSDVDRMSDSLKSPHTVSDDDNDKYFSAESSSDSEEEIEDKVTENQGREKSDASNVRIEPVENLGILGTFWSTVGRLRDYLSPKKVNPSPSLKSEIRKSNDSILVNEDCNKSFDKTFSEKSAKSRGPPSEENSVLSSSQADQPRSEAGDELVCEVKKESDIPSSAAQNSKISATLSMSSPQHSLAINYETDKNKNISLSSMSEQNRPIKTVTQSLSVNDQSSLGCDTQLNSAVVTSHSAENSKSVKLLNEKLDGNITSSQWKYRDPKVQILSPERSPTKESSNLVGEDENVDRCLENVSSSVISCQPPTTVSNEDQQEQSQNSKPSPQPALNDSFDTKMNSLCLTLSKFSLHSPTTQLSHPLPTNSDSSCEGITSLTSASPVRSEMEVSEPHILLYVGKLYSQFLSSLSNHGSNGGEQEDVTQMGDHQIPTLILHQGQDGEMIIGDVFLPPQSPLDLAGPVMLEEAHQDAIRGVWVNFVVAFAKSWEARQLCCIDEPVIVKTTVIGMLNDTDKCWTCSDESQSYKNVQTLFFKCKEEEFVTTQSSTVHMRVVRSSSLPCRDIYICGSTPTKVDADVYHTMTLGTRDTICKKDSGLPLTRSWVTKMESRGEEGIDSLPSPSRVLRSSRRVPPPISPLVKSETPSSNKSIYNRGNLSQLTPGRKVDTLPAKQLFSH